MASHLVCRKGKYWSREESYRDESGQPRKRVIAYYGTRKPVSLSDIDWGASLLGGERSYEEAAVPSEPSPSSLPTGLHTGPTEPAAPAESPAEAPAQSSCSTASEAAEASPSGPDADPSSDPSGEADADASTGSDASSSE